jgi:hypothetical protein
MSDAREVGAQSTIASTRAGADSERHLAGRATSFTFEGI